MKEKLKINVCSLAAESRIIRTEIEIIKGGSPQKGADPKCQELIRHRRGSLRNESRAALLCYAMVRGVPYSVVETNPDHLAWKWKDALKRARTKLRKLGIEESKLEAWLAAEPAKAG